MEHARPPPELQIEGSPAARADAWRKWWKQFEVFLKASGVNKEPQDVQASLLVNLIGAEGYEIYTTFTFAKEESADSLLCLQSKYDAHFGTKCNVTMLRFKFFSRNQLAGETISQYVTALKLLSQNCEFEHLVDGLIRDRIVCGVLSNVVRDRMLRTEELTLAKAVQIGEAEELSREESRQIEETNKASTSSGQVDAVAGRNVGQVGAATGNNRRRGGSRDRGRRDRGAGGRPPSQRRDRDPCSRCGSLYCVDTQKCPANHALCFSCNNRGHFARKCPSKRVYGLNASQFSEDSDDSDLYVNVVKAKGSQSKGQWMETLYINGMKLNFKLDCGADLNVISKLDFYRLGMKEDCLKPHKSNVFSYTRNKLPIIGECCVCLHHKKEKYQLKCVVVDMNVQNILGREDCVRLGFIKRVDMISQDVTKEFGDLFHGVGRLSGVHRILIDKSVPPVICPARKIPLGLRDKLRSELERMEKLEVVRKVNHPTDWVNPIVIAAKKNGDIRVCLDARLLNRAVRRAHYSLPTVSEIAARLRGAKYFSVLDARCGFWMLSLDEASADLCTFSSPFGRYQFTRLAYGISCAPEMFHAKVAMVEVQLNTPPTNVPNAMLVAFTVCTTLLVAVHMLALMISTCILPNIEAVGNLHSIALVHESPHERLHWYIEVAWAFSTLLGLILFLVEIAILCWVKFYDLSPTAAWSACVVLIPVMIVFLAFAIHFYMSLATHKYEVTVTGIKELELLKEQIELGDHDARMNNLTLIDQSRIV